MSFRITDERVEQYTMSLLARHDDAVLLEMEALAREKDFPIVERMVGVTLEILARSIGAKRVFELGSGYGYSGYWFARALGASSDAELHLTDGDAANERLALDYLGRAGLASAVTFHVGDALTSFSRVAGTFDIVYCDVDKDGYPDCWRAARERIRPGGLYICDNTLWYGRVTLDSVTDDVRPGWTEAIQEHNALIAADERYLSMILPIRDGVMVAHRVA